MDRAAASGAVGRGFKSLRARQLDPNCVSAIEAPPRAGEKAEVHLSGAIEAFLLTKQVGGCTQRTLDTYRWWLERFAAFTVEPTPLEVRKFFATLQHLSPNRQHQAYRTLKTFVRWCVETGLLAENPLRGFSMRTPKTLPQVPTEDELRACWRPVQTAWRAPGTAPSSSRWPMLASAPAKSCGCSLRTGDRLTVGSSSG